MNWVSLNLCLVFQLLRFEKGCYLIIPAFINLVLMEEDVIVGNVNVFGLVVASLLVTVIWKMVRKFNYEGLFGWSIRIGKILKLCL